VKNPNSHKWAVPMDTLKVGDIIISAEALNATLDTSVDYIQLNTDDFWEWWNAIIDHIDLSQHVCGLMDINNNQFPVCTCNSTDMFPPFLI